MDRQRVTDRCVLLSDSVCDASSTDVVLITCTTYCWDAQSCIYYIAVCQSNS